MRNDVGLPTTLLAGLMLGGCANPVVEPVPTVEAVTAEAATSHSGALFHLEDDQARIRESLSTMDRYEDRAIPAAEMEALIADGLYDPANEHPLQVGEMAPDFELMPLRYQPIGRGDQITKANASAMFEPVRLSSFRGEMPVVLIFGSYT